MRLPVITGTNPTTINDLYKKLVTGTNVQTLVSMGKEKDIKGYLIRLTLDTLLGIRADLVRLEYDN